MTGGGHYHPDRALLACVVGVLDAADSRERGHYTFTTAERADLAEIAALLDAEGTPYDLAADRAHGHVRVGTVLRVCDEGRTITLHCRERR